jgi:hypothetical protein
MLQTEEQIKLAAKLLHLPIEKAKQNSSVIKENNAIYFSEPVKGGRSLIVGLDGTVLFANSSVGYSRHIEEFNNGRRTPLEDFI